MKTFEKVRIFLYISFFIGLFIVHYLIVSPIYFWVTKSELIINTDKQELVRHVSALTQSQEQRDHTNIARLNEVADYIYNEFTKNNCDSVSFQTFTANENEYKNVICSFEWLDPKKIIIWAHYDVDGNEHAHENTENKVFAWADDNASWVAGTIELSRLIWKYDWKLAHSIDFIAYTLEELPHFRSETMGSHVHAKSLKDAGEEIEFMLTLEMIGYFTEEEIQKYPIRALSRVYPKHGNFIALIGQLWDFELKDVKYKMQKYSDIETWSLNAPDFIPAAWYSDHKSYWDQWYRAYMVTDTSFLRNPHYHKVTDTIDTLDFDKMKQVVDAVYGVLIEK